MVCPFLVNDDALHAKTPASKVSYYLGTALAVLSAYFPMSLGFLC